MLPILESPECKCFDKAFGVATSMRSGLLGDCAIIPIGQILITQYGGKDVLNGSASFSQWLT